MFDDVLGVAALSTENFREGVRDSFGASIVADVLDPILKEIDSLRIFHTNFTEQSLTIDRVLADARMIGLKNSGWSQ